MDGNTSQRPRRAINEVDRISALPDDILLLILVGVGNLYTVARAATVARRWSDLWKKLPEVRIISASSASISTALERLHAARNAAEAGLPQLELVDISHYNQDGLSRHHLQHWLDCAAALGPLKLKLFGRASNLNSPGRIQLPSLLNTITLDMRLRDFKLEAAEGADFPVLETLSVDDCNLDATDLLPRCPRLCTVFLGVWAKLDSPVAVQMPVLEELVVRGDNTPTSFHIVAPELKRLTLSTEAEVAGFTAASLKELSLDCSRHVRKIELGGIGLQVQELKLTRVCGISYPCAAEGVTDLIEHLPNVHRLTIDAVMLETNARLLYYNRLKKLPKANILILKLNSAGNHGYYVLLMVQLFLMMATGIEELKLEISSPEDISFLIELHRTYPISLPELRKMEFKAITGAASAIALLERVFTSAPSLEKMTVNLCHKEPTDTEASKQELLGFFNQHPNVNCKIINA